ncbi:hypothetical protein N7474_003895 [Penicillium riverlandense]|uniref:uncharacterized protein n=1 Tax=Penicillium riverlandense TaxID=1903569 RepID=UPI0025467A51|nr:uncharacterized protein N7474_003895 [Penicillium riverlandense]KAJ5818304.1 hypothetical protein N7474_003895 [Penicillium riverlandense]
MKVSLCALFGAAAGVVHGIPIMKRALNDATILNYALTLEHLEATFYQQGLQNYTHEAFLNAGFPDPFYSNLQKVASDEQTHVAFLTSALSAAGAPAVAQCSYSFPATDPKGFISLANVLEGVGVSAYLGAAASITNKTYLTAAGSILSVEARHNAYLRAAQGQIPFAQPFDNPLDPNEVFTVASPFITSCPSTNMQLPVKAFPSLTMVPSESVTNGSTATLMAGPGFNSTSTNLSSAFITVTGPIWAPLKSLGNGQFIVTIPGGVEGQSYIVLTNSMSGVSDDNIVAGPAIVEVESM